MSAQPHEAAPVVPLPEELNQGERHLQLVENETVEDRFANEIIATNDMIAAGEVPTVEQLDRMTATADVITDEDGKYNPIDGVNLTDEAAGAYIKNADQKSWILDEESQKDLEGLVKTERYSELADAQKELVKASKLDVMEPEAMALQRVKETAQKKLNLSEQLKAREAEKQTAEPVAETDKKPGFKVTNEDNLPEWAKLERPESVPYKEWLAMNPIDRKAAVRANMTDAEKVADLIKVDGQGKTRREDGKFLSKSEVEQIAAHEDLIREGMKDRGTPEASKETDPSEAAVIERPDSIPQEEWDALTNDEKALMAEIAAGRTEPKAENDAEVTPVAPVKGLRNRARLAMVKAWTKLSELNEKAKAYLTDEEKGSTRRKVAAGVIGTVAVAGIGYATYKGMTSGPKQSHGVEAVAGGHGHGVSEAVKQHMAHLHKGDTVWGIAAKNLGGNASNHDVYVETKRILALNHINWEQARHLAVGTEIKY